MKVRVELTLDVDAEAWANEYGIARGDVRDDVRQVIYAEVALGYQAEAGLMRDVVLHD